MQWLSVLTVVCALLVGGRGQSLPGWYHRSRVRSSNTRNLARGAGPPQTLPDAFSPPRSTRGDDFNPLQPLPPGPVDLRQTTVIPDSRNVGGSRNYRPGSASLDQAAANSDRNGAGGRDPAESHSGRPQFNRPQDRRNVMLQGNGSNAPRSPPCDKKSCSPGEFVRPKEEDAMASQPGRPGDYGRQTQNRPSAQQDSSSGFIHGGMTNGQRQQNPDNGGYGNGGYSGTERTNDYPNFNGNNDYGNSVNSNSGSSTRQGNFGDGGNNAWQRLSFGQSRSSSNLASGNNNGNSLWQRRTSPEQKRMAKLYTLLILQKILDALAMVRFDQFP